MEDLGAVGGCGRIFHSSLLERPEKSAWLATASEDGLARVWRLDSEGRSLLRHEKACEKDELLRVSWAPECVEEVAGAAVLAGGGADGKTRVWRVGASSWRQICELDCGDQVYGCEWVESRLATGCGTRLEVWDVATSERISRAQHKALIFDVSVRGSLVACALSDGTVVVNDYRNPAVVATLPSTEKRTTAVCWDADGSRIAACYGSGSVEIFDVKTWTSSGKRKHHYAPVYGAIWYDRKSLMTWAGDTVAICKDVSSVEDENNVYFYEVGYAAFHSSLNRQQNKFVIVGGDSTDGRMSMLTFPTF